MIMFFRHYNTCNEKVKMTRSKKLALIFIGFLGVFIVSCGLSLWAHSPDPFALVDGKKREPTFTAFTASPTLTETSTPTFTPTATFTYTPTLTSSPTPTITPTPTTQLVNFGPGVVPIPVLLYHHIASPASKVNRYYVDPETFRSQMEYLYQKGYHTVRVSDLVSAVHEGSLLPEKPVVITFDDGDRDVYENAYPILQRLGFTATIYLIENALNADTNLTVEMVRELVANGWEVGSHSMSHADLLKSQNQTYEICTSRQKLIGRLGVSVDTFAYPYGLANDHLMQMVQDCGYTSGAGLGYWNKHTPYNLFYFSRREVEGTFTLQQIDRLLDTSN